MTFKDEIWHHCIFESTYLLLNIKKIFKGECVECVEGSDNKKNYGILFIDR